MRLRRQRLRGFSRWKTALCHRHHNGKKSDRRDRLAFWGKATQVVNRVASRLGDLGAPEGQDGTPFPLRGCRGCIWRRIVQQL